MTGPAGDEWVAQKLSAAARAARERGAPEVAASYLLRAVAEPPGERERPELMLRLGQAEWYTGQPTAIARLEAAVDAARETPAVAAAAGALANAYVLSDQTDQAVGVLQQAIGRIGQADPQLGLRLEGASALAGIVDDRTAAAANRSVEMLRARLDDMPDAPVQLLVAAAEAAMRRAEPGDAAEQMIKRALARQPDPPLNVCTSIIVTLIGVESFGALRQLCEDMMTAAARRRSALQEMIGIASFSAWALCRMGELADAEAQARWALERATGIYAVDSLAHLVEILVERDALDAAEAELARLEPPVTSHSIMAATYLMARGQLRAAEAGAAEALADFLACGQRCDLLGIALAVYHWRSGAALAYARLAMLLRPAVSLARRWRSPARSGGPARWAWRCAAREWPRPAVSRLATRTMAGSPASKRRSRSWRARRRRSSLPVPDRLWRGAATGRTAYRGAGPAGARP